MTAAQALAASGLVRTDSAEDASPGDMSDFCCDCSRMADIAEDLEFALEDVARNGADLAPALALLDEVEAMVTRQAEIVRRVRAVLGAAPAGPELPTFEVPKGLQVTYVPPERV